MELFATEHPFTTGRDISSWAFWGRSLVDRDETFAWLRANAPVSWHRPLDESPAASPVHTERGFWAVTRAADINYVSQNHRLFSSQLGGILLRPRMRELDNAPTMLATDPPLHTAYRSMISSFFTPKGVAGLQESPYSLDLALVLGVARPALLVLPVRGDAELGALVHLARADLHLHGPVLRPTDRRVDGAIVIVLRGGDVVVELPGYIGPGSVHDAERAVAVGDRRHHDAHRTHVEDLLERQLLALHLAVDAVDVLRTTADLAGEAGRLELPLQQGDGLRDEGFSLAAPLIEQRSDALARQELARLAVLVARGGAASLGVAPQHAAQIIDQALHGGPVISEILRADVDIRSYFGHWLWRLEVAELSDSPIIQRS